MDHLVLTITLIGILGIGAQWLAWRLNFPAIVLMVIAGMLAGPILGIFASLAHTSGEPPMEAIFGEFYRPMIGIAVAVILFEGGLTLNYSELRGLSKGMRRLVFPGVPLAWGGGALAAHYLAGLSWQTSLLFGGIMVVTGPTVIIPLLRQSKLAPRPATLLKWEGIVNDPIGALLAVVVYEFIVFEAYDGPWTSLLFSFLLAAVLSVALGWVIARVVAHLFSHGLVPEYLKPPILLVAVLACFEGANLMQHEAGLLSVTVMGVTMANSRIASINELRLFKENITVLLVSGVFIVLTANLTGDVFAEFDWHTLVFLIAMLFVVRPLSVFLSTIKSGLPIKERLLLGWIAPRGIVAVAVSGFFGAALVEAGVEDGETLLMLAFAMVFATVVLHGFTIAPMAKRLGLTTGSRPGVLIVGASAWAVALGARLKEMDIPVTVADISWSRLQPARQAGLDTYYGEILSEVTEHHLDFNAFGYLLALGSNEAHNALVSTDLAPELGRAAIFQINARPQDEERKALPYTLLGRTFLHSAARLSALTKRHYDGWDYALEEIADADAAANFAKRMPEDAEIVCVIRKDKLLFASQEVPVTPDSGDAVLLYLPPQTTLAPITTPDAPEDEAAAQNA